MKKLFLLLSVLGCLGFFTQCDPVTPDQVDTLSVTPTSVTKPSAGGTFNDIKVSANTAWTASSSANWLTLSTTSGSSGNNQALSYTILQNTSEQSRTVNITITAGTKTQIVQVSQEGTNPPIVDEFLSRWATSNCGTQPYGDYYHWDQRPTCPNNYHIPSKAEFDQLITYPFVWVENGPGGVNGCWFCPTEAAKANPSTDNDCVFFPA